MSLLAVTNLKKEFLLPSKSWFRKPTDVARALADVSFEINAGEIVALVGEAGSGKTILARLLTALIRPTSGGVQFDGKNISKMGDWSLRPLRRRFQLLFSDPRTALDPRRLVSEIMLEPLQIQNIGTAEEQQTAIKHAMRRVGLNALLLDQKMTDLAAGERQKIALARILTFNPQLIICDDITRALPAGAAENFYRLMADLRQREGIAFIWLSRTPQPLATFADHLGILYRGHLVELGKPETILNAPQHPYTQNFLAQETLPTAVADVTLKGCQFAPACPQVMEQCHQKIPVLWNTPSAQRAQCFLFEGK
jgi:ABC-type oligopeptide transport system ATPase subunit